MIDRKHNLAISTGAVVSSWSLLIRRLQRARCQAEIPLIVLCKISGPPLFAWIMHRSREFPSLFAFRAGLEIAMIFAWQELGNEGVGCGTRIASPVFGRNRQCTVFSVIRKRV